jgi:hypothetical protein
MLAPLRGWRELQVPNRLNYLLWMEDLVASFLLAHEAAVDGSEARTRAGGAPSIAAASTVPVAVDIGTGASAIFPLLGELWGSPGGGGSENRAWSAPKANNTSHSSNPCPCRHSHVRVPVCGNGYRRRVVGECG